MEIGMIRRTLRALALASLVPLTGQSALAQPVQPLDGQPTAAACEALGFRLQDDDDRGRRFSAPRIAMQPPPPSPPPPPTALNEMVVSGSRAHMMPPLPVPPVSRLPMVDRDRYPQVAANPIRQTAEAPVSTFAVDVDTASYSNVRSFLAEGRRPPSDAVRVEELINYFDYGYPKPRDRARPFAPFVAVTPSPWSAERQILHIALQGYDTPRSELPPLNLVFLVDTSGSMSGPDRLPLAQKSLNVLIDQLRPQDRVAMVAYAGSAGAVLGPTDGRQKLRMRCAVGALQSGGSTAGGQGLALAYALARENFDPKAVNRVILMTDGDFNVGVADPAKLKDFVAEKRKDGVYLSVYGFGRGNYNDVMMQTLAQNGNGTAAYVDSLQEARKLFREDLVRSLFPIADDVKVQVEFNPAQVLEYRLIGYETRMLAREDFNNDQVDAGELGSGASVTALYEITPAGARPSADPLRYGERRRPTAGGGGELAFLKIRYKPPGGRESRLIERPIGSADRHATLAAAPEATRWAVAVAGFGQKLKDDPRLSPAFGWDETLALAQGARGADPYGERAEFVQLVRAAQDGRRVNE